MKKKYLVRFGSNSQSEIVELDDDGLRFAKEAGYQVGDVEPLYHLYTDEKVDGN